MLYRLSEKQGKQSGPKLPHEKKQRRPAPFTALSALFCLSLALIAFRERIETAHATPARQNEPAQSARGTPSRQSSEQSEKEMKDTMWDPAWPPLPGKGKPAKPIKEVRAMYAFAARHPEVLRYAPCYCGCERIGHESVLSCFIKGRDAGGGPQWDSMGFT